MSRIVSYTVVCQRCGTENRLPLTTQDIDWRDWETIKYEVFECGNCGANLRQERFDQGGSFEITKEE